MQAISEFGLEQRHVAWRHAIVDVGGMRLGCQRPHPPWRVLHHWQSLQRIVSNEYSRESRCLRWVNAKRVPRVRIIDDGRAFSAVAVATDAGIASQSARRDRHTVLPYGHLKAEDCAERLRKPPLGLQRQVRSIQAQPTDALQARAAPPVAPARAALACADPAARAICTGFDSPELLPQHAKCLGGHHAHRQRLGRDASHHALGTMRAVVKLASEVGEAARRGADEMCTALDTARGGTTRGSRRPFGGLGLLQRLCDRLRAVAEPSDRDAGVDRATDDARRQATLAKKLRH
mmetsp:Transcript_8248/g.33386  ORF Transcript_8248/g.33386 Transcript_8248/m.33386 type:complete len:291 (-) Transcript_8248:702-1574(-)